MSVNRSVKWLIIFTLIVLMLNPIPIAAAAPVTAVHIAGTAAAYMPAPCNCIDQMNIAVNVLGTSSALEGTGVFQSTLGITVRVSLTGSVSGSLAHLTGYIFDSNQYPVLEGTPIVIDADAATGTLTMIIGPFAGGAFIGKTGIFVGTANIVITGL